MSAFKDLSNQQFGQTRAVSVNPDRDKNGKVLWDCQCSCGNPHTARANDLNRGKIVSCGCVRAEIIAQQGKANTVHGARGTPEYNSWTSMKSRCQSQADKDYGNYGGRGIGVDPKWADSFPAFLADMGPKPTPEHTIDRKDVNGNYEPGNCRWATPVEQQNNRRNNVNHDVDGDVRTSAEWAKEIGISRATFANRLKRGITVKEMLSSSPS